MALRAPSPPQKSAWQATWEPGACGSWAASRGARDLYRAFGSSTDRRNPSVHRRRVAPLAHASSHVQCGTKYHRPTSRTIHDHKCKAVGTPLLPQHRVPKKCRSDGTGMGRGQGGAGGSTQAAPAYATLLSPHITCDCSFFKRPKPPPSSLPCICCPHTSSACTRQTRCMGHGIA